jgi:hypothetical protein
MVRKSSSEDLQVTCSDSFCLTRLCNFGGFFAKVFQQKLHGSSYVDREFHGIEIDQESIWSKSLNLQ